MPSVYYCIECLNDTKKKLQLNKIIKPNFCEVFINYCKVNVVFELKSH